MAIVSASMPDFSTQVNIQAVKSGNASDPTVWNLNRPLQDGDFFGVIPGVTLTWDLTVSPTLAGGYVQGTLDTGSAPGNKAMTLATLYIAPGGQYLCGDCVNNVPLNGTFTLTFTDTFPDVAFDPAQFGTGFLTQGASVNICGSANKTAFVRCKGVAAGSTQITLLDTPNDWNPGDQLLIPGTVYNATRQDEIIGISMLSGNVLTLATPLAQDHSVPVVNFGPQSWTEGTITVNITHTLTQNPDWSVTVGYTYTWNDSATGQGDTYTGFFTWIDSYLVDATHVSPCLYVGNLSRRTVHQSANPNGTRGHHMFMKDMDGKPSIVNACHVLVKDCGRTMATQVVTDPMVDTSFSPPQLVSGTAANPRARYAWHSHRQTQGTGYGDTSALQVWDGIVVWGFKKWAFDNHDSNVNATNLIAYNGDGACFATERGTEIGTYTNCLGVATYGVHDGMSHTNLTVDPVNTARFPADDFGFMGMGCWLQGSGVTFNHIVMSGHVTAGLMWFPSGPLSKQSPGVVASTMPWANLSPGQQAFFSNGQTYQGYTMSYGAANPPPIMSIPPQSISNCVAFANGDAGHLAWDVFNAPPIFSGNPATFSGCTTWNNPCATQQSYTFYTGFVDSVSIGPNVPGAKVGMSKNFVTGYGGYASIAFKVNDAYGNHASYTNPAAIGWDMGIPASLFPNTCSDGYYANRTDFYLNVTLGPDATTGQPRHFDWSGQPIFAALQKPLSSGQTRYNLFFAPANPLLAQNLAQQWNLNLLWRPNYFMLPNGWQLYFANEATNAVPFPTGGNYAANFPANWIGQTAAQLAQIWGVAGIWNNPPVDPVSCPYLTNGFVGTQQNFGSYTEYTYPYYLIESVWNPSSDLSYVLQVKDVANDGKLITYPSQNLQPGWNLIQENISGIPCIFAVKG